MTTLATSFWIESSSVLQVTRTCMKAWMSSNFGLIPLPTAELSAIEHPENWNKCCEHSMAFIFDRMFFILAGNKDKAIKSRMSSKINQSQLWTAELAVSVRLKKIPIDLHWKNDVTNSSVIADWIFFILAPTMNGTDNSWKCLNSLMLQNRRGWIFHYSNYSKQCCLIHFSSWKLL